MPGNNNIVLCWLWVCVFGRVAFGFVYLLLLLIVGAVVVFYFHFFLIVFFFCVCFVSVPIHGFINNLVTGILLRKKVPIRVFALLTVHNVFLCV